MTADLADRAIAPLPQALLEAVVRRFDPVEVILFGSRARGDAGPDSDWDLMVIVDDDRFAARPREVPQRGWPVETSIVALPRSRFEAERDVIGTMANMADEDGIVVWRRPDAMAPMRRRRRIVDEAERWRAAERWFRRAELDLRMARLALTEDTGLVEPAAFHLQQAAEKTLKGLLAAHAVPFRKVHRLGELSAKLATARPELATDVEGLDPYTRWVGAGRYDDADTDVPITRANVETLLGRCVELLARARALDPAREG
jgi:HEPN domain-containing protein